MSRLLGSDTWERRAGRSGGRTHSVEPGYALVADADVQRTNASLESMKADPPTAVHTTRDAEEAVRILQRLGPPRLLLVDLALPGQEGLKDGFAVIEATRGLDSARTEIIAWAPSRALREFAAHRLAGLNVRILGGAVAPAVLREVIVRALGRGRAAEANVVASRPPDQDPGQIVNALADDVQRLSGTPGVAVYWQVAGEAGFRAAVRWTADVPIPEAAEWLPRVFTAVLRTGEPLKLLGAGLTTLSGVTLQESPLPGGVQGLVALPLLNDDHHVAGMICVFDAAPLALSDTAMAAFVALGGRGLSGTVLLQSAPNPGRQTPTPAEPPAIRLESSTAVRDVDDADDSPLLNRRSGDRAIAREFARARREQRPLSFVLFDVEPLGTLADQDRTSALRDVIAPVAETLVRAIRGSDLAVHFRPEALLLVLPGLGEAAAHPVAERVRAALQAGARHGVAVAGGVVELLGDETFESVVTRVHDKVQRAREQGHNRVA